MAGKGWGGKGSANGGFVEMSMSDLQLMMSMMGKGKGGGRDSYRETMTKIQKMDDDKKVYVEGIPEDAKWKELQKHCEEAGHKPLLCEVTSSGKGVLAFKEAEAASAALAALDKTTMGSSTITTDVWTKKEKTEGEKKEGDDKPRRSWNNNSWGNSWGNDPSRDTLNKIRQAEDDRKAYVEGLLEGATWKDLEKHCAESGHKPSLCEVMRGGKGVLLFKDADAATNAIAGLSGTTMGGNQITMDVWTKKEGGSSSGPRSGGGGKGWSNNGKGGGKGWGNNMSMNMNPVMMAMMMKNAGGNGGGWGGNAGGSSGGWGGNAGGGNAGAKGGGWSGKGGMQPAQNAGFTCIVSNIPSFIPEDEFKENLKQAGNVKAAKFIGGGRASVSFATAAEANKCVSMFNGCEVGDGAALKVVMSK